VLTQEEKARITDSKHKIQSVAASLAHHYLLAGNAEKAFDYIMRVAARAMRVSAYDEVLAQTAVALPVPSITPS